MMQGAREARDGGWREPRRPKDQATCSSVYKTQLSSKGLLRVDME